MIVAPRRESQPPLNQTPARRSSVCSALLCRFRVWRLQVTTDLDDKEIDDLFVPWN